MKNDRLFLEEKAYSYRKRFLEIFTTIGFGHVTSAFSWAEIATVLYNEIMDVPCSTSDVEQADKIVVSKGHGVGMLFPIFEDFNLITKEEMNNTIKIGGNNEKLKKFFLPGFDFYGGSLGMGLGVACGMAKIYKDKLKKNRIYCIVGDAECYEGSIWEAIGFAGHQQLGNLTVVVDRNGLGCSDFTANLLNFEPLGDKWHAFNWNVIEVADGNDVVEVYEAFVNAKKCKNMPTCIIANTKKGKGLEYLVDKPLMHGYMPKGKEIDKAFEELK